MPLIFGIDTITLNPETTPGTVPLGAVVPMMGVTGSFSIPATGIVSGGFMLCDGAAIPSGNTLVGVTPNLTNNIYLRGSASAGTTGGANAKTLNSPQLPSHTHPLTIANDGAPHDHPATSSTENAPHAHPASIGVDNAPHGHPGGAPNGGNNAPHNHLTANQFIGGTHRAFNMNSTTTQGFDFGTRPAMSPENAFHGHPTGAVPAANAPHGHPVTVNANNAPHSHTITVTANNAPHSHPGSSIGTTGAGDSINFEPNYITCQYLIRVS
jgi:hypothetical protein